jgi:hypothetical protein
MESVTTKKSGFFYRVSCFMNRRSSVYEQRGIVSPKHLRNRGMVLVWATIIALILLIPLIGLCLDTSEVCLVNHQLHNAADAGALAGCRIVKTEPDRARELARDVAAMNFSAKLPHRIPVQLDLNTSNDPAGDIIIGRYSYDPELGRSIFTPAVDISTEPVNAMAVIASRNETHGGPLEYFFGGPVAGVSTANLSGNWQGKYGAYAIAMTAGGTGAGLICVRDDYKGFDIQGTDSLTVRNLTGNPNDGAIQVNSTWDEGLSITGGPPVIDAYAVNMCGDTHTDSCEYTWPDVDYVEYRQPPIPDPLSGLQPPTPFGEDLSPQPGKAITVSTGDELTLEPGYYSGGWTINGGTVRLQRGIYILGGDNKKAGLVVYGGLLDASALTTAQVEGDPETGGVMFYITGGGVVDIHAEGTLKADPMVDNGNYYQYITIFVDRNSTNEASIQGNANLDLNGTLYFPQQPVVNGQNPPGIGPPDSFALRLGGTGDGFGNQIITDSIYFYGNADVTIEYDGRNPAPTTKAYLVE